MATYTIVSADAPYYHIVVGFGGLEFNQIIVTDNTGTDLDRQIQAYADRYEAEYQGV